MKRRDPLPKRPSRITVPDRCHPAVKLVFQLMKDLGITYDELSHYSGVNVTTFKSWRNEKRPGLETLEACLGAMGWQYLPVPSIDKVPVELRERVTQLAREWEGLNPTLAQIVAELAGSRPERIRKKPDPQPRHVGKFATQPERLAA